ncbi:hypothetical protein LY78DRAFT_82378 [Colletotrichum sublineola]|nr:hypothetical protein LY78DRAFT_82378 [Colletotrichum sublineola]
MSLTTTPISATFERRCAAPDQALSYPRHHYHHHHPWISVKLTSSKDTSYVLAAATSSMLTAKPTTLAHYSLPAQCIPRDRSPAAATRSGQANHSPAFHPLKVSIPPDPCGDQTPASQTHPCPLDHLMPISACQQCQ